jgi:hypothetical protein
MGFLFGGIEKKLRKSLGFSELSTNVGKSTRGFFKRTLESFGKIQTSGFFKESKLSPNSRLRTSEGNDIRNFQKYLSKLLENSLLLSKLAVKCQTIKWRRPNLVSVAHSVDLQP